MESLIKELKKLNLSDKEAKIYLTLLELGPSTPYRIAKKSGLKRPTAYVIAEELVEKGLLIQVTGEKQRTYIARSPESYIAEVEKNVTDAKKIIPELKAIQRKTSEKPNILYFEGLSGMKQAYDYRLKEFHNKEIVGFFARATELDEELNKEVFFPWNEYKLKNNIKVRGFTPDNETLQPYEKYFKNKINPLVLKYLPDEIYTADCSLEAFDFGVRIVIMQSKQAMIIESEKFANVMKQIFELLWDKTKGEYDKPKVLKI